MKESERKERNNNNNNNKKNIKQRLKSKNSLFFCYFNLKAKKVQAFTEIRQSPFKGQYGDL